MKAIHRKKVDPLQQRGYWIKDIPQPWDSTSYKEFYENYGKEFLPELIEYNADSNPRHIVMEYIEGRKLKSSEYSQCLKYTCYKIIPSFFRYSFSEQANISLQEIIDGFLKLERNCRLYYHNDLKFNNFMITENKQFKLIDINAIIWTNQEQLETKFLYPFRLCAE